jgi:SAM-dependent methyltransferase
MKRGVLAAAFGYPEAGHSWAGLAVGRCLSWIGPVRAIIGGGVMWLEASWRGRLLDVGCGNGQFLSEMRDLGWKVTGLDPDERAVRLAREGRGIEAYQGTLGEMKFPEQSFDVITLVHVIEHAHDPVGTLRECYRVLRVNGRLVLRTPNVASLGHRIFGADWRGLEVPRHLHLFTPRTLLTCAQQAGFRNPRLWTTGRAARWTWASSRLLRRHGTLPGGAPQRRGFRVALEGLVFQAVEEGLCSVGDVGEELALMAVR